MMRRLLRGLGFLIGAVAVILSTQIAYIAWRTHQAAVDGTARLEMVRARSLTRATVKVPVTSVFTAGSPTLIFLHGAGLNARMWDPVRRRLDPGWPMIALDLPGHGVNRNQDFSLNGAAAEILSAARRVAPSRVILVGESLGGYSAMWAAPMLPRGQLAGLVIASATGNLSAVDGAHVLLQAGVVDALTWVVPEKRLAARVLASLGLSAEDSRAIIDAGVSFRAVGPAALSLVDVDFRSRLTAVDAPVLIINGSLDRNAVAQQASFAAAARQVTVIDVRDCAHGVSLRRPDAFAAAITGFVDRVGRERRPMVHVAAP